MTILRHTFTDLILGTEVVKWTSSNIYKIRIYYFFGTTFMISCHSSPRAAGHVIVLGFPDKRQKGFVHNFLFFVFQTRGIDSIEDFSTLS